MDTCCKKTIFLNGGPFTATSCWGWKFKKDFPRIPKHAPSSFWQTMDWTNSKPQDPPSFPEVCGKGRHSSAPFSALDYQTRLSVSDDIGTIIRREGKTAVLVTHDISEAVSMADRVIVFSQRPAHIQKIIPITFSMTVRTPMASRNAPEFKTYFNEIWKELNHHDVSSQSL